MNVRFASIIQLERRIKWEQSWNKRSKTTRLSTYRPPRGWAESILVPELLYLNDMPSWFDNRRITMELSS